jgi:Ca2+-binding RTX toxin-like protein
MATFNDTATDDTLMGSIGNDKLIGGIGNDNLSGGAGNDTLIAGPIIPVSVHVELTRNPSPTVLGEYVGYIEEYHWLSYGDYEANLGTFFVDTLNGGAGNDSLYSSYTAGNSILTGGLGADRFIFAALLSFTDNIIQTNYDDFGFYLEADRIYLYNEYKALYNDYKDFIIGDYSSLSFSKVAAPDLITDFNSNEGDLIDFHAFGAIWRGAANAGFSAQIGQSMALAGHSYLAGDKNNFFEFWTFYDSTVKKTILFVDSNHDFIVDAEDFRLEFNGNIPLSTASFTPGLFSLKFGTDGADNNTNPPLSAGNDSAYGLAGDDNLDGLGGDDVILGGAGNDTLNGGLGADILYGEAGNDILNGGLGADELYGVAGDDILNGDAGNDKLKGGSGSDTLNGGDGDDDLYSAEYSDFGGSEDQIGTVNILNGGAGIDQLWGGKGNDTLNGDAGGDMLSGGDGSDKLNGGAGADYLGGGSGDDTLNGGDGTDLLDGDTGADTLLGGLGNDTYHVDNIGDIVTETSKLATETDTVTSEISYTLGTNLENLTLYYRSARINATGNALNNTLTGNDGINVLTGGMGADKLIGGDGIDLFIGGKGKDIHLLTESTAATDTVRIAAGDSLINSFDVANGFKLGFGAITKVGVDKLDLASNHIASNVAKVNGIDSGLIHSHSISKGFIHFDNLNNYTAPLTLGVANLPYVFSYLQKNITTIGNTVEFNALGNTYVFQDGGVNDTLVQLTGVTANQISTTGLANHALWLV